MNRPVAHRDEFGNWVRGKKPEVKVSSDDVKKAAFRYSMETWDVLCMIEEANANRGTADVVVVKSDLTTVEIEVKVSANDLFIAEMKKDKYGDRRRMEKGCISIADPRPFYEDPGEEILGESEFLTNYFFFCLPHELATKHYKRICEEYPYAGILAYHSINYIKNLKRARKLRVSTIDRDRLDKIQQKIFHKYWWMIAN